MRALPPLSRASAFPTTVAIGLLALTATLGAWSGLNPAPFVVSQKAFFAEPWRLLTSTLFHADVFHLAFNVYWLWVFGTALEEHLGSVAMTGLAIALAAGSHAAQYALSGSGIGLSGVVYGLFGMLWALRREPRFAGAVDAQTTKLFVAWFFLCIALTHAGVWQIANVAHGAGAVLGVVLGSAIARPWVRAGAYALAAVLIGASLVAAKWWRPDVNLSSDAGLEEGQLGYDALEGERNAEAIEHLERAVRLTPREPSLWYNLGVAHARLQQHEKAQRAFQQAALIAPNDANYARAVREYSEHREEATGTGAGGSD